VRRLWAAAALAAASVLSGASAGPSPNAPGRSIDAAVPDVFSPPDAAPPGLDAAPVDPCLSLATQLARRKAWLVARREEQHALGGAPDPARWVPNATHLFCEGHPTDLDCTLLPEALSVSSSELSWSPDAGFEDYEPQVIRMRRELQDCRARWR